MAKIKGFGLRGALKFAKERGIDPHELVAGLPEGPRAVFDHPIHHGDWYAYEAYAALLSEIDRRLAGSEGDVMREMGRAAARQDAGGMFRIVTFIVSPETAAARSGIFWERYYDTGKLVAEETRHGYLRVHIEGFPDISPLHCRLLSGWIEGLGAVWGARNTAIREVACVRRGSPQCVFEGTWD